MKLIIMENDSFWCYSCNYTQKFHRFWKMDSFSQYPQISQKITQDILPRQRRICSKHLIDIKTMQLCHYLQKLRGKFPKKSVSLKIYDHFTID